jgi:hypothetical protein
MKTLEYNKKRFLNDGFVKTTKLKGYTPIKEQKLKDYFNSIAWQKQAREKLKRTSYTCSKCRRHIDLKVFIPLTVPVARRFHPRLKELLVLCPRCHVERYDQVVNEPTF